MENNLIPLKIYNGITEHTVYTTQEEIDKSKIIGEDILQKFAEQFWVIKPMSNSMLEKINTYTEINKSHLTKIKQTIMDNQQLTEGEKRVRKSFNPSALKRVENFKSITASAIDEIAEVERRVKSASKDNPELGDFLRECATAKTALQDASMWGVAALTHQITFDTFEKLTNE